MRAQLATAILLPLLAVSADAAIKTERIAYKDGDTELGGFLAYDDKQAGKRPGILVVHEWMGPGPYTEMRARQLAGEGYAAFVADIYGKNLRPKNPQEAGKAAGQFRSDRGLMRRRAQLALEQIRKAKQVDPGRIAAIGYCFGGTVALELARSGADVAGVVSFHGGLDTPNPLESKIKSRVLVLHGAADPHVPSEQVQAFQKEMVETKADWQFVSYGGAVHSFTNPGSGNDPSKGNAYDEKADKRSWTAMLNFFREIFPR